MYKILPLFLLLLLPWLQGCPYTAYGLYDDPRLIDTIADDKALATQIKASLLKEKFSDGWNIAVYCYYGHVFLVGDIPPEMQEKAVQIAQSYHPRALTTHWILPGKGERNNFILASDLRTALIGAPGLSSTRIDTEVNAGRVVLLGVVKDEAEKQTAIRVARATKGVTSVTSYLMFPQDTYQTSPPASGGSKIEEREI